MSTLKRILLVIVLIGLADSAYLTYIHYAGLKPYCPEGGIINCEQVTTSALSTVAGVPIALAGLVWFLGLGVLVFLIPKVKVARNIWIIFGLGGVIYSIAGQAILGLICEYCMLLDILIILSVYLLLRKGDSL